METPPVVAPRDGAADASALHSTEARTEGTPTTSVREAHRSRIDRLRDRIRELPTLPETRTGAALTDVLAEARGLETSGDANFVVDDLIAIRGCYRDLSRRARETPSLRDHPEYASIATSLTRVESTMRGARDIFRRGARGTAGDGTPRERLHMSRLAIRLSRDLTETTSDSATLNSEASELIGDYRYDMTLMRGTSSTDLPDRERAERIAQNLTETFDLRSRLRGDTHLVRIEDHDIAMTTDAADTNIDSITHLMRDLGTDLHNSVAFIESPHAHEAIDRLVSGIIDGDQESLVPRLSVAGLEEYCRLSATAEEAVERANGATEPAARRTALAEALQSFVALGDSIRVSDIADQMVASLPADASDTLRLQVFTVMGTILHGSGMGAESRIRELADPIARRLAETATPEMYHTEYEADDFTGPGGGSGSTVVSRTLVNEHAFTDTAAAILAARSYYSAVGDTEAARGTEERLTGLREQIDSQREGTTGSRLSIELSAASVEIDMTLEGSPSAEHLGAWRDAIRSASDLPADERLAQLRSLLRVATSTRREAESSGTPRPELADINAWASDVIGTIAEDRIRHLTTDHHIDAEFSSSVIADFRTRLGRAVTEGDTSWIGAINETAIDQFADLAQSGHVLLAGRNTPPTARDLRSSLQAAAVFSRLGLTGRVNEAMTPLLTHAEGIENTTERANFYLSLGQVYQEAGMSAEANQVLDRVAGLDVAGAPRELHRIAEMVPAMRELNLGHLDQARELLEGIHGNPRAAEMLGNVEGAIRRGRALQTIDALRILASDYIAHERERGSTRTAASEREIRSGLDEAQRLIISGRFTTVEAALDHIGHMGLRAMMMESAAGGSITSLLRDSADVTMSSDRFSDGMLAFASGLSNNGYYSAASQIGNLLTRNPHTRDAARALVEGIPDSARLDALGSTLRSVLIVTADSDREAITSGVVTIATLGLGRLAATGAELAFTAYVTESAIASSIVLRGTGFIVRSTAEAATFTLSNMAFETLLTGRTDHWTLANFGRQFGAMMVTFMFCHGIGMGTSSLGRAAARTTALGEVAATGGRTLNLTGRVAIGALGYGATITGLTGIEYFNEAIGLHPSGGNVPFLTRLLGSALMDAQMRLAGRAVNEASGGAIERWEAGIRERYAIHELLPAVERLGFGRPNAEGELSGEGMAALRAMLGRVSRGESPAEVAASVTRETSSDLNRITQTVLGVDPNTADGRRLQALLFSYRTAHPDANLAEVAGRLQIESNRLARAAGLSEGPAYDIVRGELFRRSLAAGATPESLTNNATTFSELRPGLEGVANDLLGSGGASSLEGQALIGRLLLRALDTPGGISLDRTTTNSIREQVRGMRLDPDSPAGRRMMADLLLSHLDRNAGTSEALSLEPNTEAAGSRLDGDVLRIDFSNAGFRHISVAGHGEIWFGETAAAGEIRIDNHSGAELTIIRARPLPEGSPHHATETLAPETEGAPPGYTILQAGDRIRFSDGREIVVGEILRAPRVAEPSATADEGVPLVSGAPSVSGRSEEVTVAGRRPRVRSSEGEATVSGRRPRPTAEESPPVIPLEGRATRTEIESAEPDLLAAFRHADPAAPPSRELLRRAFALADRMARQFGLSDPHDASVGRPFREAMARRAAEGPITESGMRDLAASFRTLDTSLHGADPLMRTEIRRRIFTQMLSGEISPARARELSTQIRNGEVRIEPATGGGLTITPVPAASRAEARATAERRIFENLNEANFTDHVADQMLEGYRDGSITLEGLENAVSTLSTVRRAISSQGIEPGSARGLEILNRASLEIARGRMEVRDGRIVRVATETAAPPPSEPAATPSIARDLETVDHLDASFGVLSEAFLNNLRTEVREGRLTFTPDAISRVRTLMGSNALRTAMESVPMGERVALQQSMVFEALAGRTGDAERLVAREAEIADMPSGEVRDRARSDLRREMGDWVSRALNHLETSPGYRLAPRELATPRAPEAPRVESGAPGYRILDHFNFTSGTDSGVVSWTEARMTLESFADPGMPAGPLVNLARRTRGALETMHSRSLEITRLESESPTSPRLAEARAELATAEGIVREWSAAAPQIAMALREGARLANRSPSVPARDAFYNLRLALEPGTAPEGSDLHNLRDRILEVDSNTPDPMEIGDAWLDPARGDQGRHPIETGRVTMVVRNRADIDAVARAAEARFRDSGLSDGSLPHLEAEVTRTTAADGSVTLEFRIAEEPNARIVLRVVDAGTEGGDHTTRRAEFDRASRFEADAVPIPTIHGLSGMGEMSATARERTPAPSGGDAEGTRPGRVVRAGPEAITEPGSTRVERPVRAAEPPADPIPVVDPPAAAVPPVDPAVPIVAEAVAPRRVSPMLPPAPTEETPLVIPRHDPLPRGDVEREAHVNILLLEEAFPPGIPRPRAGFFTPGRELLASADGLVEGGEGEIASRLRSDLETLASADISSDEFEGATRRLGRALYLRNNEAPFSNSPDVASMPPDVRYRFAERVGEIYGLRPTGEAPIAAAVPPVDAAAALRSRAEFMQAQRRGASDWAVENGLGENAVFRGRLTVAAMTALRNGENGFPDAAARTRYLADIETQAQTLASAAGRGEDATFVRSLSEMLTGTFNRAEAFFGGSRETAVDPTVPVVSAPVPPASTSVAPVISLRPPPSRTIAPEPVAAATSLAAFASDVAVTGNTALIGEEVFQVETSPADPLFGEVPPVSRTVYRFRNSTIGGGSDVVIALPGEHSVEEVARMVSRLSPSVRRQLSSHTAAVVGRIVEMSERIRSHPTESTIEGVPLPADMGGETVGSGVGSRVVCTGEIVGVGGGRTAFRGYVVGADGARRPVAIIRVTHSGEGHLTAEARTLNWMMEAGAGEVRLEGRMSLEGGTAIISNLAEGEIHGPNNPLPPRERGEYNRALSRDAARLAVHGLTTAGMSGDFQAIWGRDRAGRGRLQWIDTVGLVNPIDEGRSAALRRRTGHESLTAQDWYLENLRGFGLYNPETGTFAEGVPNTFQEAMREESRRPPSRSSTAPPPP